LQGLVSRLLGDLRTKDGTVYDVDVCDAQRCLAHDPGRLSESLFLGLALGTGAATVEDGLPLWGDLGAQLGFGRVVRG
jgi:hypothetical protein